MDSGSLERSQFVPTILGQPAPEYLIAAARFGELAPHPVKQFFRQLHAIDSVEFVDQRWLAIDLLEVVDAPRLKQIARSRNTVRIRGVLTKPHF